MKVEDVEGWLEAEGYQVPRDIGLLSISAALNGRCTGICEDWGMHGVRAINFLVDLLAVNDVGLSESPITSGGREGEPGQNNLGRQRRVSSYFCANFARIFWRSFSAIGSFSSLERTSSKKPKTRSSFATVRGMPRASM